MQHQKKPRKFVHRLSLLAVSALTCASASAAFTWHDIQIGGFVSQGYLKSDHNNYPVDTSDGTFDFREYAINASWSTGKLRLGGQVFGQTIGKYGDDKPILDWAVADYNFRQEFGIRAGRVKYPRSLHSDVLDADVLRPYIFLPQALYDMRLRDFQASFDGVMVYGNLAAGRSSFDYKVFYGDIPMKTDSGVGDFFNTSSLFRNPPGVQKFGLDSVRGATVAWNTPISGLRVAGYYSKLSSLVASGPFAAMPALTSQIELTSVDYKAMSLEYTKDQWTLAGEFLEQATKSTLTLPAFIAPPRHSRGKEHNYYVAVARRLSDKLELGTYYARSVSKNAAATAAPDSIKRSDWAISGRYDFTSYLLLKLEVHFITGNKDMFNVPGIANPAGALKNSMTLFAAKTTLSF